MVYSMNESKDASACCVLFVKITRGGSVVSNQNYNLAFPSSSEAVVCPFVTLLPLLKESEFSFIIFFGINVTETNQQLFPFPSFIYTYF